MTTHCSKSSHTVTSEEGEKSLTVLQRDQPSPTGRAWFAVQYAAVLREVLGKKGVGGNTHEFVLKVWAAVFAESALRKGAQHQDTLDLHQTVLDLVAAYTAFHARVNPHEAVRAVPQLVRKLRLGMALIGLSEFEQDAHIKTIGTDLTEAYLAPDREFEQNSPLSEVKASNQVSVACVVDGLEVTEDEDGWQLWDCAVSLGDLDPDDAEPLTKDLADHPAQGLSLPTLDYWAISPEPRNVQEKSTSPPEQVIIGAIERDHPRVGSAIREMWLSKEFVPFASQLIINGGDGLANPRIGFNEKVATGLLELVSLHEEKFGLAPTHETVPRSITATQPVPRQIVISCGF